MTPPRTDAEWIAAIAAEHDPPRLVALVHEFYGNTNRADRQPRWLLVLHLGLLSGVIMRMAEGSTVAVYGATDPDRTAALVDRARREVAAGASHDCGEWVGVDGRCELCGARVGEWVGGDGRGARVGRGASRTPPTPKNAAQQRERYQAMTTNDLRVLRAAFVADRLRMADAARHIDGAVQQLDGGLAILDAVLNGRSIGNGKGVSEW